ncbi:MAG: hypothetical protein M3421_04805 [Bacteroidota bacterium]|nr:hypothetical protein [Bacteroidota bacterium]
MKKALYIIGLAASMAVSIGFVLRTLSISGGYELFMGGLLIFGLFFIPLLTMYHFRKKLHQMLPDKLRVIFGFLSAILLGVSVCFKLLHLQFAEEMLLASMIVFSFGFLPFLFFRIYRKALGN